MFLRWSVVFQGEFKITVQSEYISFSRKLNYYVILNFGLSRTQCSYRKGPRTKRVNSAGANAKG